MAGPQEPRVIKGSNYIANVLFSAEVPSVFIWDVPGVKPFAAFRTELLVLETDIQGGTTRVYLLAVERLSHEHRLIDLWENPLCCGNSPMALTSKGRDQGPERMRILFSTAAAAETFYRQVKDALLVYRASRGQNGFLADRPQYNEIPPVSVTGAVEVSSLAVSTTTSTPQRPKQATEAGSELSNDSQEDLPDQTPPVSVTGAVEAVSTATSAPQRLKEGAKSSVVLRRGACYSTIIDGCPHERAIRSMKDGLHLLATTVSHLSADQAEARRIQTQVSSLRAIVKSYKVSNSALVNNPQVQGDSTTRDLPTPQHLKRPAPEGSSPHVSKRPRTSQRAGSSAAMTLLMLCAGGHDITTVRFGMVEWVADVHQLRAQAYIVGKAAWDSISALYATLRSVYRDEEEPGYACLEFPTRGLAAMFVEAWATHRLQSEEWAHAQAWVV